MKLGQLVFNAVAWENSYRLWGASRDLSKVMACKIDDDQIENIEWFKTILLDGDNIEIATVWNLRNLMRFGNGFTHIEMIF